MNDLDQSMNRRQFIQTSGTLLAFPTIVPASAMGHDGFVAPGERISVGIVGLGSRGFDLLGQFLDHQKAVVTALCDVDKLHYRDLEWGKSKAYGLQSAQNQVLKKYGKKHQLFMTADFRELAAHKGLDAVVVATPDHWHALCTLEALRNGKDVYCEKPVTHTFHEGQMVYREVAARKAVFQTGSQQRSEFSFHRAVELVRNGHLGKVTHLEVGLPAGYDKPMGNTNITAPPDTINYDFWCGPGDVLPYMRARHHRWWRGHRSYGGGFMDWIGHHNDIAHWAIGADESGPIEVESTGWTFPETKIYNTPLQFEMKCKYKDGITSSISSRHKTGLKVVGESGWLMVNRGVLKTSDPRLSAKEFKVGDKKAYLSRNHVNNFIECIYSREACIAPAETAHRSITPGYLGYVSHELGRALKWDPSTETVVGDDEANRLLKKSPCRSPWKLT
ncbi:MAG: Gfo/Idh/MocA family protein [Isosphaeraceae bacterium]